MFSRSEKTEKVLTLFRGVNDTLSYDAIVKHMGEPMDELRQTITNARRYLERDEGIVFECVRGVGYKRLSDSEKVQSSAGFQQRIRRTAGYGIQRINAVSDFTALSNADQMTATIRRTVFEAVQRETGEKK